MWYRKINREGILSCESLTSKSLAPLKLGCHPSFPIVEVQGFEPWSREAYFQQFIQPYLGPKGPSTSQFSWRTGRNAKLKPTNYKIDPEVLITAYAAIASSLDSTWGAKGITLQLSLLFEYQFLPCRASFHEVDC